METVVTIEQLENLGGLLQHRSGCLAQLNAAAPLFSRSSYDDVSVDLEHIWAVRLKAADGHLFTIQCVGEIG
jgi:hypothetical protein